MKFIHTSDWHIGRQFHNVSLLDDQIHVLNQIVDYIKTEDVDALVIAGDIYDRSVPPASAIALLDKVLKTITEDLNVPVIMISGNHDSAARLSFGASQMSQSGLHILGDLTKVTQPVLVTTKAGELAFYGVPYHDPETVNSLYNQHVTSYDQAHTYLVDSIKATMSMNQKNVLISHCFIDGAQESDSERPLSIGGSDRVSYQPCVDFDYVALGHLHAPQYKGKESIRYSGSILKYSFSEQHQKKGITLVEFDKQGAMTATHLDLKPIRNMRIIEDEFARIIEQGRSDPHNEDYLLVRLTDRHAILDPMAKLREVYPNVLQLEKPGMLITGEQTMNREKLKRGELEMFKDFFTQVSGQELTQEQNKAIADTIAETIKELNHQEKGI